MAEEKKNCENCKHNGEVLEYKGSPTICGDTDYVCTRWERWEKKYTGYGYHGGGRKRQGEEAKRATVSFVCTPSEKQKLKDLASNAGLSQSQFICKKIFS